MKVEELNVYEIIYEGAERIIIAGSDTEAIATWKELVNRRGYSDYIEKPDNVKLLHYSASINVEEVCRRASYD